MIKKSYIFDSMEIMIFIFPAKEVHTKILMIPMILDPLHSTLYRGLTLWHLMLQVWWIPQKYSVMHSVMFAEDRVHWFNSFVRNQLINSHKASIALLLRREMFQGFLLGLPSVPKCGESHSFTHFFSIFRLFVNTYSHAWLLKCVCIGLIEIIRIYVIYLI